MTPLKLAIIALGIAALIAGILLVKHDTVAGGTLLAIGGKLLGLAFPEIGAKKPDDQDPPAGGDAKAVGPVTVVVSPAKDPEPTQTPPAAALLVLALCSLPLLLVACDPRNPPCDENQLRAIDEQYAADVIAKCLPAYDSKETCPAWPALRDKHTADLKAVCP